MMNRTLWIGVGLVAVLLLLAAIIFIDNGITPDVLNREPHKTQSPKHAALNPEAEARLSDSDFGQSSVAKYATFEQILGEPSPELSDAVKVLLGLDGKEHSYSEGNQALRELYKSMGDADAAALQAFLLAKPEDFAHMRPIELNGLKNDALDMLLHREELPEGLPSHMLEMFNNQENDAVWRNYCMQFMVPLYERQAELTTKDTNHTKKEAGNVEQTFQSAQPREGQTGMSAPHDELSAIRTAMFSALDEREGTIAGTALIGLELLSREHPEFDREMIVAKVVEIASDDRASSDTRLTALRVATLTEGGGQAAEAARLLAQTGETVLLRSAAIVTLGETGTPDDRELLESFAADGNRQIAHAADLALKKMDARK